jgi:alpha-beta hydrolase superfamily lysophospholipase
MNRFLLLSFFYLSIHLIGRTEVYKPDTLGNNYQSRTFEMADDYEGKTVCTLIKKKNVTTFDKAILYVHGYNDYFYQTDLGDSIITHGYDFYALDLRKYGRSLLPNQDAFYCKNLSEYFSDLDTAISTIRSEGHTYIILMGHSTGGLITSLYMDGRQSPYIKGLILNSPFLDMNMNWFMEKIIIPCGSLWGGLFPQTAIKRDKSTYYAHSLLKDFNGEWNFNTDWKKPEGHPQRLGWVRAIHKGHKKVKKGLSIQCPILVMSSDKSIQSAKEWNDDYLHADIVLDVKDIQKYGAKLGSTVSGCIITNGIHDLILSPEPARSVTYQTIFNWLNLLE